MKKQERKIGGVIRRGHSRILGGELNWRQGRGKRGRCRR